MIRVVNKTEKAAEIYITGDIVDDAAGNLFTEWHDGDKVGFDFPENLKNELTAIENKDVTIYINSDGGSIPAGVAMANMIRRHEGHTTAIVDGWCCSIATQIFFAADTRRIPANAYLMIHKPATQLYGNSDDLRKAAETLDVLQDGLESTYRTAAKDGVTPQMITDMVNQETWLTGSEAADVFDVDVLEPMKAVACAPGLAKDAFSHIPNPVQYQNIAEAKPEPIAAPVEPHVDKVDNHNKEKAKISLSLANAIL